MDFIDLCSSGKNLAILKEIAGQDRPDKPVKSHIEFYASPLEILGDGKVEGIRLERTEVIDGRAVATGETFDVPCSTVITAIGYYSDPPEGVPLNRNIVANEDGRVEDNLYVVGWSKRWLLRTWRRRRGWRLPRPAAN